MFFLFQYELRLSMPSFLDETDQADQEDSDVEPVMDSDGGEAMMGSERSFSIQHNRFGRPLSSENLLGNKVTQIPRTVPIRT